MIAHRLSTIRSADEIVSSANTAFSSAAPMRSSSSRAAFTPSWPQAQG
ncbi:MAG: hypothetical protein ACLUI3_17160 [Christensenellales bacterium]